MAIKQRVGLDICICHKRGNSTLQRGAAGQGAGAVFQWGPTCPNAAQVSSRVHSGQPSLKLGSVQCEAAAAVGTATAAVVAAPQAVGRLVL